MQLARHGVIFEADGHPLCWVGILRLAFQLETFPLAPDSHPDARRINMPTFVRFHFLRVCRRLFVSLGRLDEHMRGWEQFLADGGLAGPNPILAHTIPDEAGIAADSVVHYANAFVDDAARVIPLALGGDPLPDGEGMSLLRRELNEGRWAPPRRVADLFDELSTPNSWWAVGFQRGAGFRQRLVHYADLVHFAGRVATGADDIRSDVSLGPVGGPALHGDFEAALRIFFADLFAWLNRLQAELLQTLLDRHGAWPPPPHDVLTADCAFGLTPGRAQVHGATGDSYLYLPISQQGTP